jgi:hypothetical protein
MKLNCAIEAAGRMRLEVPVREYFQKVEPGGFEGNVFNLPCD